MAVAVKNTPETRVSSPLDRLALASLAGVVYLLGMLWVVFGGLPLVWRQLGLATDSFLGVAGLGVVMLVAFVVLAVAGVRLFGARPRPGLRAGIFTGLMLLLLLLLVCRWIAGFVEARVYNNDWFQGTEGQWGGMIAGAICLLLCLWVLRRFFRPGFENFLIRFEEQGWFAGRAYKPGQGQRVRRGTILGILLLGASGIWVLLNRGTLGHTNPNWDVDVPFTGKMIVNDRGNASEADLQKDSANQLRVLDGGDTQLKDGTTVSRDTVKEELEPLAKKKLRDPEVGLKAVLDRLTDREKKLRASLPNLGTQAAKTATEEEANILKGWREKLEPFRDQLRAAEKAETDEDKWKSEGYLFLMQREIDQAVKQEQEHEKDRKRINATAEKSGSLTAELKWITDWAQSNRLPVLAPIIDRFRVRDLNKTLDPNSRRFVRDPAPFETLLTDPNDPQKFAMFHFKQGQIIDEEELDRAIEAAKTKIRGEQRDSPSLPKLQDEAARTLREAAPAAKPVEGKVVYASLVLLPAVRFTMPLLLLVLTLWLAWRIVNLPTFADFLIATEAEMNKVSWTTRSRLYQDTVVVLVTMFLMATFLFVVDIGWIKLLSWRPIGVLKQSDDTEKKKTDEDLKW